MNLVTQEYDVAVVGAGITGSVAALLLADKGHRVCLFERADALLGGASFVNEGKIHCGFVYIHDPSLRSLDVMIENAMLFRTVLGRWIPAEDFDRLVTDTFEYIVPQDSQVAPDEVDYKFRLIETKIDEAEQRHQARYLGMPREHVWTRSARVPLIYDQNEIVAHYTTFERSVDTHAIATLLRACLESHANIELHVGTPVTKVFKGRQGWAVQSDNGAESREFRPFDFVINAAWDGRPALDAQVFGPDRHQWFHRYKTALNLQPEGPSAIPNFTAIIGSYGDVITYPSGRVYLSWYPDGMLSSASTIDGVRTRYDDAARLRVAKATLSGLSRFVPDIQRAFEPCAPDAKDVAGGIIMARGRSDIDDTDSELHQRYRIGMQHKDGYFSVDTGKYTCGPAFAMAVVDVLLNG